MKHYIIVKLNENTEKGELINPIKELFQKAMNILARNIDLEKFRVGIILLI